MQNRELSWLTFNERVLDQGADETVPLLERLNFISIFWSNLQEFFMVRVGSLTDLSLLKKQVLDSKTGMTPAEQLTAIHKRCHELYPVQEQTYAEVRQALAAHGVRHLRPADLNDEQRAFLADYTAANIMPFLSPQIINSRHPFPHLENGSLYVIVRLNEEVGPKKPKKKDKAKDGKTVKAAKIHPSTEESENLGAEGVTVGEVVFATGMVGFEETLTDPSYYGQIITQTYPLIGNYGMNQGDMESDRIWARGYIVREACTTPSNWRCEETLDSFLKKNNTIGIEGIDTRHLTRIIRESGVMNGAILTTFDPADPANKAETDKLLETIRAYAVTDAVKNVTCAAPEVFNEKGETHIVLMHYGCKRNIVRCLVKRGCKVTVMPAFATAEEVAALNPDGIMLSNGPGDPAEPVEVIENLRHIFELGIPTFGICLGHQLSALAAGAKTMKLKYGHRGANQPVTDFESGRTFITSQNHGYAVVGDELPAEMGEVAQVNANDGTCEGIKYKKWNCFTVQFHPEANGGPKDTEFLFDRFLNNVKAAKEAR